ncbi:nuclear transport factor 2 family protein [Ectothiorhodospiraceae bacterium 2226]|nr:nuclear transport factor 2 family protein [Ectothiorhodospiraceae bacterium 2226]
MNTQSICQSLHTALESRDIEQMLSLYADDAELKVVDRDHPPSRPMELHGKRAIETYLRDVMGRDMQHRVLDEIVSDKGFALTEECRYPDGARVFMNSTIHLRGGKISREVDVQAWDEGPTA